MTYMDDLHVQSVVDMPWKEHFDCTKRKSDMLTVIGTS